MVIEVDELVFLEHFGDVLHFEVAESVNDDWMSVRVATAEPELVHLLDFLHLLGREVLLPNEQGTRYYDFSWQYWGN